MLSKVLDVVLGFPFSKKEMIVRLTPLFLESSSCVMFFCSRISLILYPTHLTSLRLIDYTEMIHHKIQFVNPVKQKMFNQFYDFC